MWDKPRSLWRVKVAVGTASTAHNIRYINIAPVSKYNLMRKSAVLTKCIGVLTLT
jgi:hypothetical protein